MYSNSLHSFTILLFVLFNLPLFYCSSIPLVSSASASSAFSVSTSTASYSYMNNNTSRLTNNTNGNLPGPKNTTHYYRPLYEPHYNSTPQFQNVTGKTVNPLIIALQGGEPLNSTVSARHLVKRDLPVGTCAPGTPCVNGACCSNVSNHPVF